MSRIGFGRHGAAGGVEDDPLDGLVNLFDLGLVLAVAFLVAGLTAGKSIASRDAAQRRTTPAAATPSTPQTVEVPPGAGTASGQGAAIGTVYRLPDGTLVLDRGNASPSSTP
ncbi:MAG: DUF2149 domain-containing protein [Solirubrobacteraceae bacterium]|nr:DUF2149 domain-containing protein [Patulibacter sp.]